MADPAKRPPLFADIVVGALRPILVVIVLDETLLVVIHARDVVAWVIWTPELLHQRTREGIETVGGNLVSRKGLHRDRGRCRIEFCSPWIVDRADSPVNV